MKRYIRSNQDQSTKLYHGGRLPSGSYLSPTIIMPDLGVHVGSLEQAQSHSSYILEMNINLKNVVTVSDQGDWNTPSAVAAILHAKGVSISQDELVKMQRQAIAHNEDTRLFETWQKKSAFYTELLVENRVSVIKYTNVEDTIQDTCYCIVDPKCIVDARVAKFDTSVGYFSTYVTDKEEAAFNKLPEWVKDITISFKYVPSSRTVAGGYVLIIQPLDDDPDYHPKMFEDSNFARLLKAVNNYQNTFDADVAPQHYWA